MYYQTLITDIKNQYLKHKSTIVFIFDINKKIHKDNLKLICNNDKAIVIMETLNKMIENKEINLNNAISFMLDDVNKYITFIPIEPITNKINSQIIIQVNSIIERLQRHKDHYNFKDIYFHREGYSCIDNSILQTRLAEQFIMDIIFFSLKLVNNEPLLENTLNQLTPLLDNIVKDFENKGVESFTEIDLQNELVKQDILITVKEKMFIQEIYLVSKWMKYKEKYENIYRFK